ncbi:MAG: hypothetical protein M1816_004067 [Peltula sp. TS41687]|nr:MAG: hypothetical protein M1816_004067 [Peltula sp. TS41687]
MAGRAMGFDEGGQVSDDDSIYDAVDLISESDDDADPDTVERVEEQNIIGSEEEENDMTTMPAAAAGEDVSVVLRRTELPDHGIDATDWQGFGDLDDPEPYAAPMNSYFESEMEVGNAASAVDPVLDRAASEVISEGKRVRFHDEVHFSANVSSVMDYSSDEGDHFGGPFVHEDELHPRFRSLIANERDDVEMDTFMGGEDYMKGHWANGNSGQLELDVDMDHVQSESSEGSSSGYETDEGETTDEDLPPPNSIASTRAVFRRMSDEDDDDDGEYDSNRIRATLNGARPRGLGPSLGSWVTDPSKPIAVIDNTGKRMIIYPALLPLADEPASSGSGSGSGSGSINDEASPIRAFAPGVELALGGLEHASGAIFPFIDDSDTDDSMHGEMEHEPDDDEIMLKIEDFIDFGDSDDDGDDEQDRNDEELDGRVMRAEETSKEVVFWEGPRVEFRPERRMEVLAE